MSSPDSPSWVDPAVHGSPSRSVDIESPPETGDSDIGAAVEGETITVCASFWKYASIGCNLLYILLLFLEVLENPLSIHANFDRIIVALLFALSAYGALKFNQIFVFPSIALYTLFIIYNLFTLNIMGVFIDILFCIPQLMLVREIRRGIHANPDAANANADGMEPVPPNSPTQ